MELVEVTLRGPTHQDIGSKDLSDVEYFPPGPVNTPSNSPSLKSHTRKVHRVRSVSVDYSNNDSSNNSNNVVSPFKIVRSASVDGANRCVTTYKIERSPTSDC